MSLKEIPVPFVHKFQTSSNKYIYDANSLDILKIGDIVWDIIDDIGKLEKSEIIDKYKDKWKEEQVSFAHDEIVDSLLSKKISSKHPKVFFKKTKDAIKDEYVKNRKILILNVAKQCNFSCKYCPNDTRNKLEEDDKSNMDWETAKKAIDLFMKDASPDHRSVTFYGGEPLLNIEVIKKSIEYVRQLEKGYEVFLSVSTNGSLMTDEVTDVLASHDVHILMSFDGSKEMHDRYRRTTTDSPTWDVIMNNVHRYIERHPEHYKSGRFGLSVVVAPPVNVFDVIDFFSSFVIKHSSIVNFNLMNGNESGFFPDGEVEGMDELYGEFKSNLEKGLFNDLEPGHQDLKIRVQKMFFEQAFVFFHRRHEYYGSFLCKKNCNKSQFGNVYYSTSSCVPGIRRTLVDTDGRYYPCERMRYTEYTKIGNVDKGFDYDKTHIILEDWVNINKEECENCWRLHGCQVGCFADICQGEPPTKEIKQKACESYRQREHAFLIEYCSILEGNPNAMDYMKDVKYI